MATAEQPSKVRPFTYWVGRFHFYSASASTPEERVKAMVDLYNEWESTEHKYKYFVTNPFALFLSVSNYVPDRTLSETPTIGNPGTRLVRWDDNPIYDTWANYRAGIEPWTCIDWKNYHIALKAHYNDQQKANMIWEADWWDDDNTCYALHVFICPDTDLCRYSCNFVEYFASQGIRVGNALSNATCDLSSAVTNVTTTISNVSNAIKDTSSVVSTLFPIATGSLFIWWGYDKFIKDKQL